ncbi:MAG TPA: hypothetical protein DDW36_01340 [Candidatus Magasanikbacteria bacterium]|nr:hypothetical protein [Candidatus Magasanikbacteria bacterium]
MPFNPFEGAFGLDIGDTSLKLVRVHSTPKPFKTEFKLLSYGRARLPEGALVNGEVIHPEPVVKTLKELVRQTRWRKAQNWVVASVPETKTFLKYTTFEPDEEITAATINTLIEEHIPLPADELYVDWQTIPAMEGYERQGLMVTAAPKQTIDSYTYLLEIAGLSPLAFELESVALARALVAVHKTEEEAQPQGAQGILDVGASSTTLVIYDHNAVQLTRTFDFSGNYVTELISHLFNTEKKEAEMLKHEKGFDPKGYNRREWTILAREAEYLTREIERTLTFYQNESSHNRHVETIHLCGGGANALGLDKLLSTRLKIMVHAGNPWQNLFTKKISPLTQADLHAYATAIGLALRAASNPLVKKDEI